MDYIIGLCIVEVDCWWIIRFARTVALNRYIDVVVICIYRQLSVVDIINETVLGP